MTQTPKHTPGPWQLMHHQTRFYVLTAPQDSEPQICEVNPFARSPETVEANARLIAAAPDLLAALEGMAADLDCLAGTDTIRDWQEVCAEMAMQARAAIARATGQSTEPEPEPARDTSGYYVEIRRADSGEGYTVRTFGLYKNAIAHAATIADARKIGKRLAAKHGFYLHDETKP